MKTGGVSEQAQKTAFVNSGGVSMKQKDLLIMSYLRQNSRAQLTTLARKTGIPVSTIFDRLKMKASGLIKKHTSLVDFSMLGFNCSAYVMLKAGKNDKQALKEHLSKSFYVNNLHKVNNGYDFLVQCVCRDLKQMEEFLDQLEQKFVIKSKEVHYIVEDLCREAFLSDPQTLELVMQ